MIECFSPIAKDDARVLILGSIPSVASLQKREYYGHKRNAFWYIMSKLLGFEDDLPYNKRAEIIVSHHIAIWDVINRCKREGSLDSAIKNSKVNDFGKFFGEHREIKHIFFNGQRAYGEYKRYALPILDDKYKKIPLSVLPSTSPANAKMSRDKKLEEWKKIIKCMNLV